MFRRALFAAIAIACCGFTSVFYPDEQYTRELAQAYASTHHVTVYLWRKTLRHGDGPNGTRTWIFTTERAPPDQMAFGPVAEFSP